MDAAEVVVASWQWCVQYQHTLAHSLSADKFDAIDGLTDRELLEIAMLTDYITDAHMWKVVTEQCTIADVVADYVVWSRRRALRMLALVLELSATCTTAADLLRSVNMRRSDDLLSSLVTVADIVRNKKYELR
jgi:hypothetical protein